MLGERKEEQERWLEASWQWWSWRLPLGGYFYEPQIPIYADTYMITKKWADVLEDEPVQETRVRFLGQEHPFEGGMAVHSSIVAWRIPWTEKPGGLQFLGLLRVRHDWPHVQAEGRGAVPTSFRNLRHCATETHLIIKMTSIFWTPILWQGLC